jgi:hypothetical protein
MHTLQFPIDDYIQCFFFFEILYLPPEWMLWRGVRTGPVLRLDQVIRPDIESPLVQKSKRQNPQRPSTDNYHEWVKIATLHLISTIQRGR